MLLVSLSLVMMIMTTILYRVRTRLASILVSTVHGYCLYVFQEATMQWCSPRDQSLGLEWVIWDFDTKIREVLVLVLVLTTKSYLHHCHKVMTGDTTYNRSRCVYDDHSHQGLKNLRYNSSWRWGTDGPERGAEYGSAEGLGRGAVDPPHWEFGGDAPKNFVRQIHVKIEFSCIFVS